MTLIDRRIDLPNKCPVCEKGYVELHDAMECKKLHILSDIVNQLKFMNKNGLKVEVKQ